MTTGGGLLAGLVLFFVSFNTLEATLPSLISRVAPITSKGTATGVYNSSQFLGVFIGGAASGGLSGLYGYEAVFMFCLGFALLWLLLSFVAPALKLFDSKLVYLTPGDAAGLESQMAKLGEVSGVVEVNLIEDEGVAYVKIDPDAVDSEMLDAVIK